MTDTAARTASARRLAIAAAVIVPWLLLLTWRQASVFPVSQAPSQELMPPLLALVVLAAAVAARIALPSTATHLWLLIALVFALSVLAAQLGSPLNGTEPSDPGYCGDICRTTIFFRLAGFLAWPIVAAIALWLLARFERRPGARVGSVERAAWSSAWAVVALVAGLTASIVWWRIVLPAG